MVNNLTFDYVISKYLTIYSIFKKVYPLIFTLMSNFFYKYITAKSLIKGKKTTLYFSRFIFQVYRTLPLLLKLATVSFRFFYLFYTSCSSLIHFKFWLLVLNHFVAIYQCIFLIRILTEYFFINQHQSNKVIKTIFCLSEPYFKFVQKFLPTGIIGSILSFVMIGFLADLIKSLTKIVIKYNNDSTDLKEVYLLLNTVFDEKIVFS